MKHSGDGGICAAGASESKRCGMLLTKHTLSCYLPPGGRSGKRQMKSVKGANSRRYLHEKDESYVLHNFSLSLCSMIIETRIPSQIERGYVEGPHCSVMFKQNKHLCNTAAPGCAKYKSYVDRLVSSENYPFFNIEVLLLPECCPKDWDVTLPPNIIKKEYILLERWSLSYRNVRSSNTAMSSDQLLRAVRSSLHFSQLSAWLSTNKGKNHLNVFYWIKLPDETFDAKFDCRPDVHVFPSWQISEKLHACVTVMYRPRAQSLPKILCTNHNFLYPHSQQTSAKKSISLCSTSNDDTKTFPNKGVQVNSRNGESSLHCISTNNLNIQVVSKESKSHSLSLNEKSPTSSDKKTSDGWKKLAKRKSECNLEQSKFKTRHLNEEDKRICSVNCSSSSNNCDQKSVIQTFTPEIPDAESSANSEQSNCLKRRNKCAIDQSAVSSHSNNESEEPKEKQCRTSLMMLCVSNDDSYTIGATSNTNVFPEPKACISNPFAQKLSLNSKQIICESRLKGVGNNGISTFKTKRLLTNFEEAILHGCFPPSQIVPGFKVEIAANGSFRPDHLTVPVDATFCELGNVPKGASPYLVHVLLPQTNYYVPKKGALQVTLFNPNGNVVKMFLLNFDLTNMPPLCHTFMRQRMFFMPIEAKTPNLPSKSLCYVLHIRFASTKAGRIYLKDDMKILVMNNSCNDAVSEEPHDFQSFVEMPSNPSYSSL